MLYRKCGLRSFGEDGEGASVTAGGYSTPAAATLKLTQLFHNLLKGWKLLTTDSTVQASDPVPSLIIPPLQNGSLSDSVLPNFARALGEAVATWMIQRAQLMGLHGTPGENTPGASYSSPGVVSRLLGDRSRIVLETRANQLNSVRLVPSPRDGLLGRLWPCGQCGHLQNAQSLKNIPGHLHNCNQLRCGRGAPCYWIHVAIYYVSQEYACSGLRLPTVDSVDRAQIARFFSAEGTLGMFDLLCFAQCPNTFPQTDPERQGKMAKRLTTTGEEETLTRCCLPKADRIYKASFMKTSLTRHLALEIPQKTHWWPQDVRGYNSARP